MLAALPFRSIHPDGHAPGPDAAPVDEEPLATHPWPMLDPSALHGLAGDVVRAIDPQTEADPAAVLVSFLVGFGNMAGGGPHAIGGGARHPCNEFAIVVGNTAKARKGTAWKAIRPLLELVDPDWRRTCVVTGLSSGEGLINAVRDGERDDPATADPLAKRLLAVEEEFARVLRVMRREGNALSAILREAWDDGTFQVLVRTNPLRATGAHVSVLGHVTRRELLAHLQATDISNGLANRFLWVCARRSKKLPEGGLIDYGAELPARVLAALRFARGLSAPVARDAAARAAWAEAYETLTEGSPGALGEITNRAEPHVLRLSLLYAVLDRSPLIRTGHLAAALALWRYCEESAAAIFGPRGADALAGTILAGVRAAGGAGLTRTAISDLLGRNKSREQIAAALAGLIEEGLVAERREGGTGGRPRLVYHLT